MLLLKGKGVELRDRSKFFSRGVVGDNVKGDRGVGVRVGASGWGQGLVRVGWG